MARAKMPRKLAKPKLPPTPKAPKEGVNDKRPCNACGAVRKMSEFKFVMPALIDPTEYACTLACYQRWCADREAKGLGPWGDTPEKVAARRNKSPQGDTPALF